MSVKALNITLGADPELFVISRYDGKFIPSLDLIGGSKMIPRQTSKEGFAMQEDNVLVEFNIPPTHTRDEFIAALKEGRMFLDDALKLNNAYTLVKASAKFTPEQLTDPRAKEFGCDPDRNAWNEGRFNSKPSMPEDGLRTAGGHIHVGYQLDNPAYPTDRANIELTQWLDLHLGVPSVLMDKDEDRRKLYGKAGAYRDKFYGVEYRTLSSFWLLSDELMGWAHDQTHRAIAAFNSGAQVSKRLGGLIMEAINSNNKDLAKELVLEHHLETV